ncbi:MAG: beta-hydroxyacyl-ACP dehydratase [Deltaproteobacteria bacterium]|nr:beta-hydroxyacyl-ACP dehydratase [Deltaproteobacteria bacterium]
MAADRETMDQVLNAVPQQRPFRFIDSIRELDDEHCVGTYRFREDEFFYRGHFPDFPVTPGVILIETLAQTGVVAFGIYLTMRQMNMTAEQTKGITTLFTIVENVEFLKIVEPGEEVIMIGEKIYFRKGSLKSRIRMETPKGEIICSGVLAGTGARLEK